MKTSKVKYFKQQGVVLFVALIALVVMSLAAVALIRSVDTNTIIAGNMALKHTALVSSDRGVETALEWLSAQPKDSLFQDKPSQGYYATYNLNGSPDLENLELGLLKSDATWENASYATGIGIVGGTEVSSGNQIKFIVQRICRVSGGPEVADKTQCLQSAPKTDNYSKKITPDCCPPEPEPEYIYRITTRVKGPKNTTSYAQTFVY